MDELYDLIIFPVLGSGDARCGSFIFYSSDMRFKEKEKLIVMVLFMW